MIDKISAAAIGLTAAIFGVAFAVSANYLLAVIALLLGAGWLLLEVYRKRPWASPFFAAFVGVAVVGGLNHAPVLLILPGVMADLAAWDLARFAARLRPFADQPPAPDLVRKHLIRLAITLGAGFGLAGLALLINLPLDFAAFAGLTLLAVIALRQSLLHLQDKNTELDRR